MKKYLFLVAVIIAAIACNKTEADDSTLLQGKWKMVSVQDRLSLAVITNPGNMGNVVIIFAGGMLSGQTPSNDIWPSAYTTGPGNQLSAPAIGGTKVGENAWGGFFYDNMPLIENYSFRGSNNLIIGTRYKKLRFERL